MLSGANLRKCFYLPTGNSKKSCKFAGTITSEIMYRQIFIPTEQNINIPIPQQWWGRKIEVIAFPVSKDADGEQSLLAKRKELDETLDQYLFDFSAFKFDCDEANNYQSF
ncbi:MAG: hypothetical protein LBK22_03110 [Tannerella sp.]|nr:hypothetical protein [Tannerella sp.]